MVKINFDIAPTNSTINILIQYIKKYGINGKLYADIAKLFTMDTSKVTEKFLRQLAYLFATYYNNPRIIITVFFFNNLWMFSTFDYTVMIQVK